ncbi:hypothetical protein [Rugamonas apoptosis]|uniref:Lipoprotein n=1 Tax=Rugamonas apoptosis TaxID=2758570 RepID=A0A7W2F735_9BURK|nr:hypothetical protein [Rugamonas apoptosis]MBA5686301.1 hypothetical protein [Rugamonas apoptosis]
MMRRLAIGGIAVAMAAVLTGCYTVDQNRFSTFVAGTVMPGMPMEQALVRMAAEGFYCDSKAEAPAIVCTRSQQRIFPGSCIEQVDLRRASAGKAVGTVDIAPIKCVHW